MPIQFARGEGEPGIFSKDTDITLDVKRVVGMSIFYDQLLDCDYVLLALSN
jgi:hypothetical protein